MCWDVCFILDQKKRFINQSYPEPSLLVKQHKTYSAWRGEGTDEPGSRLLISDFTFSRLHISQNLSGCWSWPFCFWPCKSTLLTTFHKHLEIVFQDHQQKSYVSKKRDKSFWGRHFWASQEVMRKWDIHCIAWKIVRSSLKSSKHNCFRDHAENGLGKM